MRTQMWCAVSAVLMLTGCMANRPEPVKSFARVDGQSIARNERLRAQMQADGQQCLAYAKGRAIAIANPQQNTTLNSVVVHNERGGGPAGGLMFNSGTDRQEVSIARQSPNAGDPDTFDAEMQGCMGSKGYVWVDGPLR